MKERPAHQNTWLDLVLFDPGDHVAWNDPVAIGLIRHGVCVEPTLTLMRIPNWAVGLIPRFLWFVFNLSPVIEQSIRGSDGRLYSIPEREIWLEGRLP
jgi:hypothetical protein